MVNKVMSSMHSFEQASLVTADPSPHRVIAQLHVDAKPEREAH